MSPVITQGYGSKNIITQGYVSGEAPEITPPAFYKLKYARPGEAFAYSDPVKNFTYSDPGKTFAYSDPDA